MKDILEGVSPRPWRACRHEINGKPYGCFFVTSMAKDADWRSGTYHACISGSGGAKSYTQTIIPPCDHDDSDANAHFIVHAVNTYEARDQLIAELVEALEVFASCADARKTDRVGNWVAFKPSLLIEARTTLTRAKEVMKG